MKAYILQAPGPALPAGKYLQWKSEKNRNREIVRNRTSEEQLLAAVEEID
jgi:hypothetical protein